MDKDFVSIFGSEWFAIPVATLALAEVYILAYGESKFIVLNFAGEFFMFLGLAIFAVIFILWTIRSFTVRDKPLGHWDNLTRFSFISLIPIIAFVGNYQLIYFFGLSATTAYLSLADYIIAYSLALILGVLLGYRLYTKEIDPKEINYAIVIPPLAIGTSVFLGSDMISHYGGTIGHSIYFLTIFGLGIFFFLYIFIGSLAFAGHVSSKNHELLPTTMLPVGIASLIVINLLTLVGFNKLGIFIISPSTGGMISVLLWGFEVWNFLVVVIIIFTRRLRRNMSVWAYGFPLGLFAASTLRVMTVANEGGLIWLFVGITVSLNIVWVYAWLNTIGFMLNRKAMMDRLHKTKIDK
ncbi:MAG: hypothetical protein QXI38_04990 [Conexivisphaerales archaeon]